MLVGERAVDHPSTRQEARGQLAEGHSSAASFHLEKSKVFAPLSLECGRLTYV
jgi:hypothetical protein